MAEVDVFETRFASAYRRYLDEAPTGVDAMALVHAMAAAHPRRKRAGLSLPWRGSALPRPAQLVLLVALMAALVGGLLYAGARWLETRPPQPRDLSALVPTGIDLLNAETRSYVQMAADGDGMLWARDEDGRLARFDPATGSTRTWSIADDVAFRTTTSITPATAGGIWLIQAWTLRWFDGERFRRVVEAPAEIAVAVEAPDATLWAATVNGNVLHWDGSSWSSLDPVLPDGSGAIGTIGVIAVDSAGHVWIDGPGSRVSRHDGSGWTTWDAHDAMAIGSRVSAIVEQPDGVVWIAASFGMARFDGAAWTDVVTELSGTDALGSLAVGPDGSIWSGERGSTVVRRFDGRSWASYGPADGLPEWGLTASVVVAKGVVYVGTHTGIYRLTGSRWEPVEPPVVEPTSVDSLLAVSRDELWAIGDGWEPGQGGVWHFENGAWTRESIDPGHPGGVVNDLAFAPDGTLWAASEDAVAYRRDARWTIADSSQASAIAIGRTGTVWYVQAVPQWTGRPSGIALRRLAFDGTAWVSDTIVDQIHASSLAIDANGALWADQHDPWDPTLGGLTRYDGQRWETIREIAGATVVGPSSVLGSDPSGDIWVAVWLTAESAETSEAHVAHYDGTDWTVVPTPDGASWPRWPGDITTGGSWLWGARAGPVLDPNGTLWSSTARGPARYDDGRWTYPYAEVAAADAWQDLWQFSVAADGTVYGSNGPNVLRLPAEASRP